MAIDSDKINQCVMKWKTAVVLHTWKDYLWSVGSKSKLPEAVSVFAVGYQDAVWAIVEVRIVAAALVPTPCMALASVPLGISLLTRRVGPWQAPRRSLRQKAASLVHAYSSDAQLIIPRTICSSTSRALANSK
jgi:hypothetical protein